MNDKEVIVFNSHGVGQYAYTNRMPKWGETLSVKNWHIAEDGGKGTNVAVALGRLGIDTAYIGKVGKDPWGDLGETWLKGASVDTTYLYRTDEVSTGTGLILLGPNGENAIIDGDSSSIALKEEEVISALDNMKNSQYLITGFEIPPNMALLGAKYAKQLNMKTILNPSPLPEEPLESLNYVDYLFINEVEGKHLCDMEEEISIDSLQLMKKVKEKYEVETVVMTLGERGSMALDDNSCISISSEKVKKVVNTAGAGDGFMAATIANLVWGKSLKESMEWASKYAALSVTIDGTIPAYRTLEEVINFINR